MNSQPFSVDSTQVNYLRNLEDIDDIFNGLVQDEAVQLDEDFEDFLECFSDEEDEDEQVGQNYNPFPSNRNVSPSFQFSTFAPDSEKQSKRPQPRTPAGDSQFPVHFDENPIEEDSVEEDDDLSDFFESFEQQEGRDDNIDYVEIKYFDDTYKIPIFTAKLFEPELSLEERLIFTNTELVTKYQDMHQFFAHLKQLHIEKLSGDYSFSAFVLKQQQIILAEICARFHQIKVLQQIWLEHYPSVICRQRVDQFNLQLRQFIELVNYVFDYNTNKLTGRRYFDQQKPAYFQDQKKNEKTQKEEKQTEEEKILQLQQIPHNQNQQYQSSLMSILIFKALQLVNLFTHFQSHKGQSDSYKRLTSLKLKLKSFLMVGKLLRNRVRFTPFKTSQQRPSLVAGSFGDIGSQQQIINIKDEFFSFYKNFRSMRVTGIVDEFMKDKEKLLFRSKSKRLNLSRHNKNCFDKYMQFTMD